QYDFSSFSVYSVCSVVPLFSNDNRRRMASSPAAPPKKAREWAPRIWEGCNLPACLGLLARNRFAVQPPYWYIAAIVSAVSTCHTLIRFYQEIFYRHAIRRTPIAHPPLFVLGHWRTGTTLLH